MSHTAQRNRKIISPGSLLQSFLVMVVGLLVLYGGSRLVFWIVNRTHFEIDGIAEILSILTSGIRYDLSAIAVANILIFLVWSLPVPCFTSKLMARSCKYAFMVFNGIFLMTNLIDVAYYPFLQRRMQFDVFQYANGKKGNEALGLLPRFVGEYWYLFIVFFVLLWLLHKLWQFAISRQKHITPSKINYIQGIFLFLLAPAYGVLAFRGGLQLKPIDIINAAEVSGPKSIPLVINSPFSIYKSSDKRGVTCRTEQYQAANNLCFETIHLPDTSKSFERRNVVIIIVESLSEEYMSGLGGASKTPFLDSLMKRSLVYRNAYANAKESIQGIPAIVSSIPSWQDDAFIFSPYSSNEITSFANLLRPFGYHTSFYHGGTKGTMGFDAFCKLADIEHYYGREQYNNEHDYDGHWGIWDEPFLQYMAKQLSATPEPFFSTVFTLNTHHPFLLPAEHQQRFEQLPGHPILQSVQYADYALRRYFETISKTPWYRNTLFVITADHTGPALTEGGNFHKQYRIPIVFFDPSGKLQGESAHIANQIDILPTIMQYIHYPKPFFALGSNLMDSTCNSQSYTYQYNAGVYTISDADYTLQSDLERDLGLFAWRSDPTLKHNISATKPEKQKELLQALQRKMSAFCTALNENKMK